MSDLCFHCDEPIPQGTSLFVTLNNAPRAMCCVGCQAVAKTIIDNNLSDYYRFRSSSAQKSESLLPEQLKKSQLLDDENLQDEFTFKDGELKETILSIEGINCAACAWLIEMQLLKVSGVENITVNATTQRATVRWRDQQLKLSQILMAIDKVGYHALPFKASQVEEANQRRSKAFIRRLGISGILMMQVLMIASGLYFGAFSDMSVHNLIYLRWVSLILTLPIVSYGAWPFYSGAMSALKAHRLSMDVPVAIAIILAFIASSWATFSHSGEVYFESVAMFTFLLLIGKFLEFRARNRAAEISANLLKLMPMTATRIIQNKEEFVIARKLQPFDNVTVKPGETIPADGIIISGKSQINEAMLSGEQLPISKSNGAEVYAGTINGDGNLTVEVKHASGQSFLSQLIRMSETSQSHKPKLAQRSDKIAQYFVAVILLSSIASAIYWQQHLPEQAFWITLSVLVATCPCALSLATPTALTCATTRLNRDGIMIKSPHVLETFPEINCFAFDKTGTLTTGDFVIDEIIVIENHYSQAEILASIAALESHSEHPIAKAFHGYRDISYQAKNVEVISGAGITGNIVDNKLLIGKPTWLHELGIITHEQVVLFSHAQCLLAINNQLVAIISLRDDIRSDAKQLIDSLHQQDISTMMLSGDNHTGCQRVQHHVNINNVYSQLSAVDKMDKIKSMQDQKTIAMVGDGINDTPVFGAAHVSLAMGAGTDLAKSGADVILLNNKLNAIHTLQKVALKTKQIVWQNYGWAFAYNAIVLPLAVSGHITPYMAVIGMSLSSLLVITNSLRLLKVN